MENDILVVGAAMATPVGLWTDQVCASVRAGISRFEGLEWRDKTYSPITMAAVPDNCLPDLADPIDTGHAPSYREKRLIRLAGLTRDEIDGLLKGQPVPFIVGLPDPSGPAPVDADLIFHCLPLQMGLNMDKNASKAIAKGRASGLMAIDQAVRTIRSGKANMVLAGGCDTYKDINVLGFLNVESRLASETGLDGFIPGEGAAFLLLSSAHFAKRNALDAKAKIVSAATGFEPGHLYSQTPYQGEGLFQTFQNLFDDMAPDFEKIRTVYSSMNGESHWVKEWGVSFIRFSERFDEDMEFEHPADCHGDLGAASGPAMLALAATALAKGHRKGPMLVYASSDHGDRSAVLLDSA